jgi:hypothetical protein
VVKAKVVAVLEIRISDNNSHTEVAEEASLKAGGGQRGRGNWNRQQSGSDSRDCHYCGKPCH